uniref:Uncharacterized protein n=1 Tax=Sander lucioperca TaxID=283035 RepID=A0A8C9XLJ6_SANLU
SQDTVASSLPWMGRLPSCFPPSDVPLCFPRLERKWLLWHDFMTEHAHLDAWLRLAEQAVGSPGPAHVAYGTAKEDVRKFERLRCEAGPRLVQLDGLTRRNRTLTRLFRGAMQARLLAAARQCGQRWDDVSAKLESITGRLKVRVLIIITPNIKVHTLSSFSST